MKKTNLDVAMRELVKIFNTDYLAIVDVIFESKLNAKKPVIGEVVASALIDIVVGALTQNVGGVTGVDDSYLRPAVLAASESGLTIYELHKENNYEPENVKNIYSISSETIFRVKVGWLIAYVAKIWFVCEQKNTKIKLTFHKRGDGKKLVDYLKKLKEQIKLRDG